jgi:very-short-patch-repair endonuclease
MGVEHLTPAYKVELAQELRARHTAAETLLWPHLRAQRLGAGLKFRRQHPVGRFVADFLCEGAKLVVELDGGYHDAPEQQALDREREAHFTGRGYAILRFPNAEVTASPRAVARKIADAARARLPKPPD